MFSKLLAQGVCQICCFLSFLESMFVFSVMVSFAIVCFMAPKAASTAKAKAATAKAKAKAKAQAQADSNDKRRGRPI